jgi:hypothetical protein
MRSRRVLPLARELPRLVEQLARRRLALGLRRREPADSQGRERQGAGRNAR